VHGKRLTVETYLYLELFSDVQMCRHIVYPFPNFAIIHIQQFLPTFASTGVALTHRVDLFTSTSNLYFLQCIDLGVRHPKKKEQVHQALCSLVLCET